MVLNYHISEPAFRRLWSELTTALYQESMGLNAAKRDRNGYSILQCQLLIRSVACSISWELITLGKISCIPLPRSWIWGKRRAALRKEIPILSLNIEPGEEPHTLLLSWSLEWSTVATWFTVISVYVCTFPCSPSSPPVPNPITAPFRDAASVIVKQYSY